MLSSPVNEQGTSPETARGEYPRCRFHLDNDSSATLDLPDGRKLGYAQYGLPTGRAVFYLHGTPGSRIEAAAYDDLAVKADARIIAVDRPGIGLSSPQPNRTLLDHPKDIEQLARHLDLNDYGVLVWPVRYFDQTLCDLLTRSITREYQEADRTRSHAQLHSLQTSSKPLRSAAAWDRLISVEAG